MQTHFRNTKGCNLALVDEPFQVLYDQLSRPFQKDGPSIFSKQTTQVSTTSLFNVYQRHFKSLREYLTRFNEATIKEINLIQEMFVGAFFNKLKFRHIKGSLTPKLADLREVMMSVDL